MSKVLLISEDFDLTNQMRSTLEDVGFDTENVTLISMMAQGGQLMNNKSCSILVVDTGFSRHDSLITEMTAVIRSFSIKAPLYLVFKGDYDRIFDIWTKYAKRTFQLAIHPQKTKQVMKEIIRLETSAVSRQAYYSPMDSI